MFYVYILKLADKTYYKGQTNDIDKRIKTHNSGFVESTKKKLPFKLIHVELVASRIEARKIEKFFKSGFGREIIQQIDI